jgi:hypothetical protein
MAVSICPSCHERFRYDSREELEVLAGDAAVVVPDGGPLTFRSHERVVHACPIRQSGLALSAPRQALPGDRPEEKTSAAASP